MNTDDRKICEKTRSSKKRQRNTALWTPEADALLLQLVEEHGEGNWARIADFMPIHTNIQIRQHWTTHLDVNIKKGPWTLEEVMLCNNKLRWARYTAQIPNSNVT
jgi:hypothetical protein